MSTDPTELLALRRQDSCCRVREQFANDNLAPAIDGCQPEHWRRESDCAIFQEETARYVELSNHMRFFGRSEPALFCAKDASINR